MITKKPIKVLRKKFEKTSRIIGVSSVVNAIKSLLNFDVNHTGKVKNEDVSPNIPMSMETLRCESSNVCFFQSGVISNIS